MGVLIPGKALWNSKTLRSAFKAEYALRVCNQASEFIHLFVDVLLQPLFYSVWVEDDLHLLLKALNKGLPLF